MDTQELLVAIEAMFDKQERRIDERFQKQEMVFDAKLGDRFKEQKTLFGQRFDSLEIKLDKVSHDTEVIRTEVGKHTEQLYTIQEDLADLKEDTLTNTEHIIRIKKRYIAKPTKP